MNEKKICFITCVNDSVLYSECLKYINNLKIPEGFQVEKIAISSANSITSAYNKAMKDSDAKYKVYLHQDVFIINNNFIEDVANVFESDEKIGIIGMTGAKTIPTTAKWWEAFQRSGGVYENHAGIMKPLLFDETKKNHEKVKALDGFLLVTDKDIPWREDIFTGWHFYDMSQCVEFTLKGYNVVVPWQEKPWCIHDCGFVETTGNYDKYRSAFLDEYSKRIFPQVSIMITAYNRPEYFKLALESAINQSYKNVEIIVCDNSTNNYVKKVCAKYLQNYNIKYYKNEVELEVIDNFNKAISLANSEYLCFLMDDDLYNKDKLKVMMNYFIQKPELSLVTSHRQTIDEHGNYLKPIFETQTLFEKKTYIDEKYMKALFLNTGKNFIGETTTPIFKKSNLTCNKFGIYENKSYSVISDIVTWISMSEKGAVLYVPETLSYFRIHKEQDQKRMVTIYNGVNELVSFSTVLFEEQYIDYSKKQNKTYYNLLLKLMDTLNTLCKDDKILESFLKNNIVSGLLNSYRKLLFYIKDSNELKDISIKNNYDEIITKISKNHALDVEVKKNY